MITERHQETILTKSITQTASTRGLCRVSTQLSTDDLFSFVLIAISFLLRNQLQAPSAHLAESIVWGQFLKLYHQVYRAIESIAMNGLPDI